MTLEEMKAKVYSIIEEYSEEADNLTEDEDLAAKMNTCINTIMNEMSRFKKIDAYTTMSVTEGQNIALTDIDNNLYQLNIIHGVEYEPIGNRVKFNEEGTAEIYYYKYPEQITNETEDSSYTFELDTDALEIMPYGVAGLLLASDVSNNYGQIYTNMYREKITQLDSRKVMPSVYISGGSDI
jgi:hypothetical protein